MEVVLFALKVFKKSAMSTFAGVSKNVDKIESLKKNKFVLRSKHCIALSMCHSLSFFSLCLCLIIINVTVEIVIKNAKKDFEKFVFWSSLVLFLLSPGFWLFLCPLKSLELLGFRSTLVLSLYDLYKMSWFIKFWYTKLIVS